MTTRFMAKVWLYPGAKSAWHFITVPKKESADIKKKYGAQARGWGSLPVEVTIGKSIWKTSIFPDKKSETYLLPFKSEMRRKENIEVGDSTKVTLTVLP